MNRAKKELFVSELSKEIENVSYIYVYGCGNVSSEELFKIRLDATYSDINVKFVKNTLAKRALNDQIQPMLEKTSVLCFGSGDPLNAAHVLARYEKEYKGRFVSRGGLVEKSLCDKSMIKRMSSIGSVDGLRSLLLGVLQAPMASFARVLNLIAEKEEGN
ncbi:50S ribosomal protein L10 [Candidatus Cytomitobacter indipagum]|uniref:Large ribosomal subunit protein uL10 n=1 Tax=Candidatus Cytomitobacter indipagum TaxID=2601575 RepID=A0A5C0UCW7_9PROT|nr:50S ribosomal protein L10 [Candidatus Cytomitobacter indipagum]QEK37866.1 50S ribosomal protein L10 [Candidatus Cytomitobacter indipagum]